jgi:hypothetical protein
VPLRAELRTDRGDTIRDLPDPFGGTFNASGDFDRLVPNTNAILLRYVDQYGDTAFNHLQMEDLLRDLRRLTYRDDLKPTERRGLDRLRVMAERCRDESHLYLWFIGD